MKIGTSSTRHWGGEFYKKLRSFGFECIDFNLIDTEIAPYTYGADDFEKYFINEKRMMDEAGITVSQVHGPWRHPAIDNTPEARAERMEKMKRSIHGAALLGSKYWVVHPIMPFGVKDVLSGQEKETHDLNLEFMRELLETAKHHGVTICLENMPFLDFSLSSPEAIVDIVKEINDPFFAMCLDTGHANVCRSWDSPAESIRKYGEFIKVLHVHDNRGRQDEHLAPLFGSIDWKDFSDALREVGFDGVLSLEAIMCDTLPADILEDMYDIYGRIARRIADGDL